MQQSSNRTGSIPRATVVFLAFAALSLVVHRLAHAQTPGQQSPPAPAQPAAKLEWKGDPYLLPTDPVSGEKLPPVEKQTTLQHQGREFRFASAENASKFGADPAKYIPAVDAQLVRDQSAFYPLDTCLVSGEKLGPNAVDLVYKNRLVRLASREHEAAFLADPAKYVAKLDEAVIAKQKPTYAPKTCAVSGEAFGGEMGGPVDYVVGNRLIRLCCKNCRKDIEKDPLKYLSTPDKEVRTEAEKSPRR